MNDNENWKLILKNNNVAKIFNEFFKDWTCPTWVARHLHGGKRNTNVTKYFDKFQNYLDTKRMKKDNRTGYFSRGNLEPFYQYALSKIDSVKFTDEEKKFIEFCFELPGMRNIDDSENFLEGVKNKLIEFFIKGLDANDELNAFDEKEYPYNKNNNFVKKLLNKKEINDTDIGKLKEFIRKNSSNGVFPELGYNKSLVMYANDLGIFDKINLLIPPFYRKLIHFPSVF